MESLGAEEKRGLLWNLMDTLGSSKHSACVCRISARKRHTPLDALLWRGTYNPFTVMNEQAAPRVAPPGLVYAQVSVLVMPKRFLKMLLFHTPQIRAKGQILWYAMAVFFF